MDPGGTAQRQPAPGGLAAALWALLVVAPFAGLADPAWWYVIAAGTALVTGGALRARRWPLAHAGLAAGLVLVVGGSGVVGLWPLPLVFALAGYAGVVRMVPALRSTIDWARWKGRPADRGTLSLFSITVVLSVIALVLYAWLARPDVAGEVGDLDRVPVWFIPVIGLVFVVVNPAVEEALYRGLLYRAFEAETGSAGWAIAAQAVAFGALHVAGFPGGAAGMIMAGGWGVMLGIFRARTGGMRWSWWAHVAANVVIFGAVLVLAADQGVL